MKLFSKIVLLSSLVLSSEATTLKEILHATLQNNENLKALEIQNSSLKKSYESVKNIYNPNINLGVNYLKLDADVSDKQIGSTVDAFAKVTVSLYDGGKSSALKKQKEFEFNSAKVASDTTKKSTLLQVITLFFQTKTVEENINVFYEKSVALKAQYERVKTKYDIKMTTIDEVLKLKSEYESTQYLLEELKYQKEELLQNLSLITNISINSLEGSSLPEYKDIDYIESPTIKSMKLSLQAQKEAVRVVSSINYPQLKIEDSFNIYDYSDYNDKILNDLPEQQNQLMVTLSYNLFNTSSSHKVEALRLSQLASDEKLSYIKRQEKMKFELSIKKLTTMEHKIESLKSAVEMGDTVYDMVKIKYQNGIVDNITYLDALSKKAYNNALYQQALNDYEIAKANYYFTSGVDYKKVISSLWKESKI